MSADLATVCLDDLIAKIEAIPQFAGKVFHVYSEEELIDKQKGLLFPCVGVIYDGIRAVADAGGKSSSASASYSILAFFRSETFATTDAKDRTVLLIDLMRSGINGTRSPSGHWWKFQIEASIPSKKGLLVYLQRWSTAVQLTT